VALDFGSWDDLPTPPASHVKRVFKAAVGTPAACGWELQHLCSRPVSWAVSPAWQGRLSVKLAGSVTIEWLAVMFTIDNRSRFVATAVH
jgi:hypothetical protein